MPVKSPVLNSLKGPDAMGQPAVATSSVRRSLSGPDTLDATGGSPFSGGAISFQASLSGADTLGSQPYRETSGSSSYSFTGSLSGADTLEATLGIGTTSRTSGILSSGTDTSLPGFGYATHLGALSPSSPYYFLGSMSEEVMHRYLDKAIEVTFLSLFPGTGPTLDPRYNPFTPGPLQQERLYSADYQHGTDLALIQTLGAKMVKTISVFEGSVAEIGVTWLMNTVLYDIELIHFFDPEIICGTGVYEVVPYQNVISLSSPGDNWNGDNRVSVSRELIDMFYAEAVAAAGFSGSPVDYRTGLINQAWNIDAPYTVVGTDVVGSELRMGAWTHGSPLYFDYVLMRFKRDTTIWPSGYPNNQCTPVVTDVDNNPYYSVTIGGRTYYFDEMPVPDPFFFAEQQLITPDITQPETQMWYYYQAMRYIDAGCESFHMGDIWGYCALDKNNGYKAYWNLLTKIRAYASVHARRSVILLEAHCIDQYGLINTLYYDPNPDAPVEIWNRKLLHDFQTLGVYFGRFPTSLCTNGPNPENVSAQTADQPTYIGTFTGLINISSPGWNPQGWYCAHSPFLLGYDNGGNNDVSGCYNTETIGPPDAYGYEGTSWYVNQEPYLKNLILLYCYFRIRCLDPYGHFQLPVRTVYEGANFYELSTNTTLQTTIIGILNGAFAEASPYDWVYHNFMYENVINFIDEPDARAISGLIFVGDYAMYYIGSDGIIHGIINANHSTYNDGSWININLSIAAGLGLDQPWAKSDLVASPDGSMLLFIGADNQIHGYNNDGGTYSFFTWAGDDAIIPMTCLIFPENDRVYYIGLNRYSGTLQVHGFQSRSTGFFTTVSPTYSAGDLRAQALPAGGLNYVKRSDWGETDVIYYRTADGGLSFFKAAANAVDYTYGSFRRNDMLFGNGIRIIGNLAINDTPTTTIIYFVGVRLGDGGPRVFLVAGSEPSSVVSHIL